MRDHLRIAFVNKRRESRFKISRNEMHIYHVKIFQILLVKENNGFLNCPHYLQGIMFSIKNMYLIKNLK